MSGTSGITHTSTGDGITVSNSVWSAEHTYSPSTATNSHRFVWKDADTTALSLEDQVANTAFTDLDLTAATSSNAKAVLLQLYIYVTTANKTYSLAVRKNGTTPTYYPILKINADGDTFPTAASTFYAEVTVGCDSSQIIEYATTIEAAGQASFFISVLGYWE